MLTGARSSPSVPSPLSASVTSPRSPHHPPLVRVRAACRQLHLWPYFSHRGLLADWTPSDIGSYELTRVSPVSGDASRVLNAQDMGAMFARAMLLVFVSASFAACQDNDRPGSALDRSPELKSSLDSFRKSVKTSGCAGRVVIDLTVTETGEVQNPKIASPTRLESRTDITDQIHDWRFCPAVRFNRYATVRMRFNIQVTAED